MLCKHNRRKSECKYCGLSFCQHYRKLIRCKECGFEPKNAHIINKSNIVKIAKELKYANIIVEKQIVKNAMDQMFVFITYIKTFAMNVK